MPEGQSGRGQGFWLTAGEVVGALALIIGALNLWESHRQHTEATRRAGIEDRARMAFVAVGKTEAHGRSLLVNPLSGSQAIISQRYDFPRDVQANSEEITAAQPRIEENWLAAGLSRDLVHRRQQSAGHDRLPVVIETTYVEDGETRLDRSLYDLGYDWKPRLFGGKQIRLTGLALVHRGVSGDPRKLVDSDWAARRPVAAH